MDSVFFNVFFTEVLGHSAPKTFETEGWTLIIAIPQYLSFTAVSVHTFLCGLDPGPGG